MLALGATLSSARPAVAQVTGTGTIEIVVQDQGGLAVPGANVVAQATDSVTKREGVTDAEGRAVLVGLAPSAHVCRHHRADRIQADAQRERAGSLRPDRDAARSLQRRRRDRAGAGHGRIADRRRRRARRPARTSRCSSPSRCRPAVRIRAICSSCRACCPTTRSSRATRRRSRASTTATSAATLGVSSDNFYYFNGINVTDPVTGTFGANLNTEIIQEQKVLTGGIPAEFVGTPGLLSSVITKSGTNAFNGSGNYFFQNADLVAENKNSPNEKFSTFDAAFTSAARSSATRPGSSAATAGIEREDDVTTPRHAAVPCAR